MPLSAPTKAPIPLSSPACISSSFDSVTGRGIEARVDDRAVLVGTRQLLAERGIERGLVVDLGCGKGRVVLQAARRYRLKRVVGVELAPADTWRRPSPTTGSSPCSRCCSSACLSWASR